MDAIVLHLVPFIQIYFRSLFNRTRTPIILRFLPTSNGINIDRVSKGRFPEQQGDPAVAQAPAADKYITSRARSHVHTN